MKNITGFAKAGVVMMTGALALCASCGKAERENADAPPPAEQADDAIAALPAVLLTLQLDEALLRERLYETFGENDVQGVFDEATRHAADFTVDVFRARLKLLGIRKSSVTQDGDVPNRILVQFPEHYAANVAAIERLLTKDGALEFRLVHSNNTALADMALNAEFPPPGYVFARNNKDFRRAPNYAEVSSSDGYAWRLARFGVPPGESATVMMMMPTLRNDTTELLYTPVYVSRRPVAGLSSESLTKAKVERDSLTGRPQIVFTLNSEGAKVFGRTTTANIDRQLAIIVDGIVYSAPIIREPITKGIAVISGDFTPPEADELCILLKSGALKAPFNIIDRQRIAP
ncbi:MAG: hypothetical protein FWF84_01555 [Kiritimatiellaeota bacterium]|nr:hypothetical protein [Kiritimatiellota bacterium]